MTDASAIDVKPDSIVERAEFCAGLIREAGDEARQGFVARTRSEVQLKGPQDYLTETDLAVETLIKRKLSQRYPTDGFLGEETGGTVSGAYWVVDPIDGTANFARGIPHYAVVMAFVSDAKLEIGAIYNPEFDELYLATNGNGATLNGKPLHVSDTSDMDSASVELGWSNRLPNECYINMVTSALEAGANVRRASSGALGLAYVADGRSDGYAELHMNAWDCLAGQLIIAEAGGIVEEQNADVMIDAGGRVIVDTPPVFDELLAISEAAFAPTA